MTEPRSDIMRGSPAYRRLQDGIPENIAPQELRRVLHDYNNVLTAVVPKIDDALDLANMARRENNALEEKVFDSEKGIVTKLRSEYRNSNTWIVRAVVGGLVTIIGVLVVFIVTLNGGPT